MGYNHSGQTIFQNLYASCGIITIRTSLAKNVLQLWMNKTFVHYIFYQSFECMYRHIHSLMEAHALRLLSPCGLFLSSFIEFIWHSVFTFTWICLIGGPSDLTVLDVWFCDATLLPLSLEDLLRPELPVFLMLYKYLQYSIYKQSEKRYSFDK